MLPSPRSWTSPSSYLAIEKARFGDRLPLVQRVAEPPRSWALPPVLLQPVVETPCATASRTWSMAARCGSRPRSADGRLRLAVENPFDPSSQGKSRGTGTGLDNVKRRLRLIYGGQARLTTQREDHRFVVEIELPRPLAPERA